MKLVRVRVEKLLRVRREHQHLPLVRLARQVALETVGVATRLLAHLAVPSQFVQACCEAARRAPGSRNDINDINEKRSNKARGRTFGLDAIGNCFGRQETVFAYNIRAQRITKLMERKRIQRTTHTKNEPIECLFFLFLSLEFVKNSERTEKQKQKTTTTAAAT